MPIREQERSLLCKSNVNNAWDPPSYPQIIWKKARVLETSALLSLLNIGSSSYLKYIYMHIIYIEKQSFFMYLPVWKSFIPLYTYTTATDALIHSFTYKPKKN